MTGFIDALPARRRARLPVVLLALLTALQVGSGCAANRLSCSSLKYFELTRSQRKYVRRHLFEINIEDCYRRRLYQGFDILENIHGGMQWFLIDRQAHTVRLLPLKEAYFKGGLLLEPLPGPLLDSIGGRHDTARVREFQRFLREEYDHPGKPILLR